jgi:hypothetical protein
MTRLMLALAAWISLVSVLSASLTPTREPFRGGSEVAPARTPLPSAERPEALAGRGGSDFVVTERTEVLLNGKPCRYETVPPGATIVQMEVAADGKTVLKVQFRTRK